MKKNNLKCDMSGPEWSYRNMTRAHHCTHDVVFDKLGLKEVGQPILLFILDDFRQAGEKCTQKELAELMHISPSTLTISIKSLERRGYVKKISDKNDLRRNFVEITELGCKMADKCYAAIQSIDDAMYSGFTSDEVATLTSYFSRITGNLIALAEANGQSKENEV